MRENPKEAETTAHRLMLKAGLVRMLGAGIYSYLPLGWKVLQNIATIVREEMNRIGGVEFFLPVLSPSDIWEESGRWDSFGDELFRLKDRKGRSLCLSPTHEEIITHLARQNIKSYKELPQIWYQIQTKFRDEPRPRSAVVRARQFIMKDSYTMDTDEDGLNRSYNLHFEAYTKIFTRCGLDFFSVEASGGVMGTGKSEEFMVPCASGEDRVVRCTSCNYRANLVISDSKPVEFKSEDLNLKEVSTPGKKTVEEVSSFLKVPSHRLMKSLLYTNNNKPIFILIRGDYEAAEEKIKRHFGEAIRQATEEEILNTCKADAGFIGPVGLENIEIYADTAFCKKYGFITGANKNNYHLTGVTPERDFKVKEYIDLKLSHRGDRCIHCNGELEFINAIEVGHIFQLGKKYSISMGATFGSKDGARLPIVMGSYGIGLERIMASAIETFADSDGICWPLSIAPFKVIVVPLDSKELLEAALNIYKKLLQEGIEVLLDDRDQTPGVKFKDADLIGIPFRITVGERYREKNKVELYDRREKKTVYLSLEDMQRRIGEICSIE